MMHFLRNRVSRHSHIIQAVAVVGFLALRCYSSMPFPGG